MPCSIQQLEQIKNICRLVQVCKAWRTAVQQSNACLTDISCTLWLSCTSEEHAAATTIFAEDLAQFNQWLKGYAGTVRSIDIGVPGVIAGNPVVRNLIKHAHSALGLALSAATQTEAATKDIRQAAAAVQQVSVVSRQLQLQSFTCPNFMASPSVLAGLPAATLTQLELEAPELAGKLSRYHGQLWRATGNPYSWNMDEVGLSTIDLVHLTALQQLHVEVSAGLKAIRLPQQLRTLELTYDVESEMPLFANPQLQLQQLTLHNSKVTAEDLVSLTQLQQLTRLELSHMNMDHILQAAPAWQQLAEQLVGLKLRCWPGYRSVAGVEDVFQVLGQLKYLQELQIELSPDLALQENDIAHLSALTNLTQLRLHLNERCRAALDSHSFYGALQQLSELQHLTVYRLNKLDVLQTIGNLRQLTYLHLYGLSQKVQQEGLGYLTGLHSLCELHGFNGCSDELLMQFWADVQP